ncbi:hypothetical protein QO002_004501 [Pararhizobium capsulatum DSM 1112]|uniref:Capsule polysaccharide biosynthesis protein n=1 Tax=Pararhizobium capsulatum DSM 1112 TaxID=1121113 RepID=A0ABU0BXZ2_9HYPH|nr:hypothetical protein [Pararhizobium capsulatum]MDQ0322295.1 hypothetical protein [Pararhizobium capsulatum DSM 1112]
MMKSVFFIDSKSRHGAEQYRFAFENSLFSAKDVEVLVKFRLSSFWGNILAWWKFRFRLRFVLKVRESLLSKDGGCIYYFFNSPENVKLIKNRMHAHVFLGHGESNKRASLHPLYRMYDYLLVAGPYAGERLKQYGLLNQVTLSERMLDIGGAGVANIGLEDLLITGNGEIDPESRALLYMPTWEGGLKEENYSTLDEPLLGDFLAETAAKFSLDTVYIKPHPNTGNRIRQQKKRLAGLIAKLNALGIKVVIPKKDIGLIPLLQRLKLRLRRWDSNPPTFLCAIVDVSAAESMAAKSGIPSIVLMSSKGTSCAPPSYVALKGRSVIRLNGWSSMRDLATHVYRHTHGSYQRTYIDYFRDDENDKFRRALIHIENRHTPQDNTLEVDPPMRNEATAM